MKQFFFTTPEIGAGLPVLDKNGSIAKQLLTNWLSELLLKYNYYPVSSPHIGNVKLFERSGHYPYYKDSMFNALQDGDTSILLKPMNCPYHIAGYENIGNVSYNDLPIKIYEFGQVYRNEDSGALNGLFRVKSFTQDDGHIFCSFTQIESVVKECIELVKIVCEKFKLNLQLKLSVSDAQSDKYVGDKAKWNDAERILSELVGPGVAKDVGGAAFYGPKIDFIATDKMAREWQLGTIQLDFNLPERFDLNFTNASGLKERPVLIHRALLGSIERFLAILLENDLLPMWMRPFNLGIINLDESDDYLNYLLGNLKKVYPTVVRRPANLQGAMASLYKSEIDQIVIIGKREAKNRTVNFNKTDYTDVAFIDMINTMYGS